MLSQLTRDQRWELAAEHVGCGTNSNDIEGDTRTVFSLFSPIEDADDPNWLNLIGIAFGEPKSSFFDPGKSAECYLEAATKHGHCAAEFNIGTGWLNGKFGRIDVDRARFWLARAVEHGHGCAGAALTDILRADSRFGDPAEKEYNDSVVQVLQNGAENGGPFAMLALGALEITGNGIKKDAKTGLARYIAVAQDSGGSRCKSSYPKAHVGFRLGSEHYIRGDFDGAREWLSHVPAESHSPDIRYRLNNAKSRINFRIEELLAAKNAVLPRKNAHPKWVDFIHGRDLIADLREGRRDLVHADSCVASGAIPANAALNDLMWAVCSLAMEERWPNRYDWANLWTTTQAALLGVARADLIDSTNDLGPTFNKSENGFHPIPGAFLLNSDKQFEDGLRWRKLRAVTGNADGTVTIVDEPSGRYLLDLHDVEVAWVLAFGRETVIWPTFSLEPHDKLTPERDRWSLSRKEWDPHWLAHTAWGKTMYASDALLGEFGASPATYSDFGATEHDAQRASYITDRLRFAGGEKDGDWGRVMLYPKVFYHDVTSFSRDQSVTCEIHHLSMAVLGANCAVEADGTENRKMNANDNAYAVGRHANMLTEHFDEIAELVPVYERMRQLDSLLYGLSHLRKIGFCPNAAVMQHIEARHKYFQSLPQLPLAARLTV